MSERADLEALIRTQIEVPAFRRILDMVRANHIGPADAELFRTSAERYKRAALAGYESFDPRVRDELLKSLLIDYQNEINRLIDDIAARPAAAGAEQARLARTDQPDTPPHERTNGPEPADIPPPSTRSLLDKVKRFVGNPRPPK